MGAGRTERLKGISEEEGEWMDGVTQERGGTELGRGEVSICDDVSTFLFKMRCF